MVPEALLSHTIYVGSEGLRSEGLRTAYVTDRSAAPGYLFRGCTPEIRKERAMSFFTTFFSAWSGWFGGSSASAVSPHVVSWNPDL